MKRDSFVKKESRWLYHKTCINLECDFGHWFIKRHWALLLVYKLTKLKSLARFIAFVEKTDFKKHYLRNIKRLNYQPIFDEHLLNVERTIRRLEEFPNPLKSIRLKCAHGFNNDQATSLNVVNHGDIIISAGIAYYAHLWARSLQLLFTIKEQEAPKINLKDRFLGWYSNRMFRRSCVAHLLKDHTNAFSLLFIIPEDDSLLFGMEIFVVAHEYSHLLLHEYGVNRFSLNKYYSSDLLPEILANEENICDAISMIVLANMIENGRYYLYAPCIFFAILSYIITFKKGQETESNSKREVYLERLMNELSPINEFVKLDSCLNDVFNINRKRINRTFQWKRRLFNYFIGIVSDLYEITNNE